MEGPPAASDAGPAHKIVVRARIVFVGIEDLGDEILMPRLVVEWLDRDSMGVDRWLQVSVCHDDEGEHAWAVSVMEEALVALAGVKVAT